MDIGDEMKMPIKDLKNMMTTLLAHTELVLLVYDSY
jgi:hypothetical protein